MTAEFHPQTMTVSVQQTDMGVTLGSPVARDYVERDPYTGDYEITPTAEVIVLETKDKRMTDHVRVLPVPQNYGLITWDGSTLTVS